MVKLTQKLKIKNKIAEHRTNHGITQQKLAQEVEVTRATIIAIEKGNYNPSLELAFRLAKYFKTDINQLFMESK
jgi:putative transcriptional regulator